ncbi:hypothetical protein SCG7109_AK_00200 [Chlamydiales bacterium SCGC AG-110-M15]|nr:hypothetical protein SCG7109_AK_00200 [Chlamydiales bacterium SCGC AG-110-M15]
MYNVHKLPIAHSAPTQSFVPLSRSPNFAKQSISPLDPDFLRQRFANTTLSANATSEDSEEELEEIDGPERLGLDRCLLTEQDSSSCFIYNTFAAAYSGVTRLKDSQNLVANRSCGILRFDPERSRVISIICEGIDEDESAAADAARRIMWSIEKLLSRGYCDFQDTTPSYLIKKQMNAFATENMGYGGEAPANTTIMVSIARQGLDKRTRIVSINVGTSVLAAYERDTGAVKVLRSEEEKQRHETIQVIDTVVNRGDVFFASTKAGISGIPWVKGIKYGHDQQSKLAGLKSLILKQEKGRNFNPLEPSDIVSKIQRIINSSTKALRILEELIPGIEQAIDENKELRSKIDFELEEAFQVKIEKPIAPRSSIFSFLPSLRKKSVNKIPEENANIKTERPKNEIELLQRYKQAHLVKQSAEQRLYELMSENPRLLLLRNPISIEIKQVLRIKKRREGEFFRDLKDSDPESSMKSLEVMIASDLTFATDFTIAKGQKKINISPKLIKPEELDAKISTLEQTLSRSYQNYGLSVRDHRIIRNIIIELTTFIESMPLEYTQIFEEFNDSLESELNLERQKFKIRHLQKFSGMALGDVTMHCFRFPEKSAQGVHRSKPIPITRPCGTNG